MKNINRAKLVIPSVQVVSPGASVTPLINSALMTPTPPSHLQPSATFSGAPEGLAIDTNTTPEKISGIINDSLSKHVGRLTIPSSGNVFTPTGASGFSFPTTPGKLKNYSPLKNFLPGSFNSSGSSSGDSFS